MAGEVRVYRHRTGRPTVNLEFVSKLLQGFLCDQPEKSPLGAYVHCLRRPNVHAARLRMMNRSTPGYEQDNETSSK